MERNIIYVENDKSNRERFSRYMQGKEDLSLELASSIDEAKELLKEKNFKCLVSEAKFSEGNVEEIFDALSNNDSGAIPVLFTDRAFDEVSNETMIAFSAYVNKNTDHPFEKLIDEIESLLESESKIDYPVPDNEKDRLEFLERYDIDSLVSENDFNRLAKLGSELFDTKWCFVGIVTQDKERFLSFENSETQEMDRSCTICTFAINEDDVMVVKDREKDPRFKYVDELDDMGIKWYAGAPMITEDGYRVGAFCVMDTETRSFSQKERELLRLLADEAVEKLELKRKTSETILDKIRGIL